MAKVSVGETELHLAEPLRKEVRWIGRGELLDQLLACWTLVTEQDLPLCPRIIGKPGMGKTTLAMAAAARMGCSVYVYQCTMDTRPEDLVVTPVLSDAGGISYHASPLVSAMVEGGIVILDEANRMSEKSWASLAPLLDHRRYVDSVVCGARIDAHPEFRCCVTMNDDASTYEVPDYIISRLQPLIEVGYPDQKDELAILRYNVDFAPDDLLDLTTTFLQEAHRYRLGYSTRDGINIMRFALKLRATGLEDDLPVAFHRSVEQVLGAEAEDFETRARGQFMLGPAQDLTRFFTTPDEFADPEEP